MSGDVVSVQIPEAHYTLFNVTRGDLPEVIVVNDALLSFRDPQVFQWHLEVYIDAVDLIENRMPSPEESAILFEVGDRIEERITGRNALFLARSTWNATRELSFRVHDPEEANAVLQTLLNEQPHRRHWEYVMRHDPDWELAANIFRLFPMAGGLSG
jgi:hypothetical protein